MKKIIKIIKEEYQNPYPKDIFLWDNKEKMDLTRGRFNEFTFQMVECVKHDIIEIIEENLSTQVEKELLSDIKKRITNIYENSVKDNSQDCFFMAIMEELKEKKRHLSTLQKQRN